MLQQDFGRSSAQNRGLKGDVRPKSGEPAPVPTAVGPQKTEIWLEPPKQSTIENILPQERYQVVVELDLRCLLCAT